MLILLGLIAFHQVVVRLIRRYWHFPAPPFISVYLDSPWRKTLQPPEEVVGGMGIRPGMTVLELGPGPGTFTLEATRRTLPDGKVLAVDVEPRMLARLRRKASQFGVVNLETYQADACCLPFPENSVDLAFMVTVLAEIPDRARALAELRRVLKPGGTLSVSEFVLDPDYPRRSTVIRWCQDAGFQLDSTWGSMLWYVVSFRKPSG